MKLGQDSDQGSSSSRRQSKRSRLLKTFKASFGKPFDSNSSGILSRDDISALGHPDGGGNVPPYEEIQNERSLPISNKVKLTGRVLQTLVEKAAYIVDANPAKVALCLVKAILEISQTVANSTDAIASQMERIGDRLRKVEEALQQWRPSNKSDELWVTHFKVTLHSALENLKELGEKSQLIAILDHENIKEKIAQIFGRIDDARVEFELALGIRVFKAVYEVDKTVKSLFLDRLKPSDIAHHDFNLEGKEGQMLHRQVCTPGTRVGILDDIVTWAKDTSEESPSVFWLFGHVGSGKTTIAYTIARRFEFAGDPDGLIVLGGNYFSSRQFDETRLSKYIVRTIVYHLALKCKPFAESLCRSGRLEVVTHNISTQLDGLLFGPWKDCELARRSDPAIPPHYLIVIDALDEIEGTGGSDFLRSLVDIINNDQQQRLNGLKFFVTSRSNKVLVDHVNSLERKRLYRLQDVKEEDARADIAKYLCASLPIFAGRPELDRLQEHAAGLFIYAATVVKLLENRQPVEQKKILKSITSGINNSEHSQSSLNDAHALLNRLYYQIMVDAFGGHHGNERTNRLRILYTFLCAKEPLSISSVVGILFEEDPEEKDPEFSYAPIAEDVVDRLHSVLYVEYDKILFYHKSFPDFLTDKARSIDFWLNLPSHHRHLADNCFRLMKTMLRFNIANIPTSFYLDWEINTLKNEVDEKIPPNLRYACRNWDYHLSTTVPLTPSEPLNEALSRFLELTALFWIEAMNLLGSRRQCYPMLQVARNWVMQSEAGTSLLHRHLTEAAYFAVYFTGSLASSSTAHLYISTLATWPRSINPCGGWKTHFPGIPQFRNATLGRATIMSLHMDSCVNTVAMSSDGTLIATGLADGSIGIWDAFTGESKHLLDGHEDQVKSIAFSENGTVIASGSADRTIRLWDAITGEGKGSMKGHRRVVNSVAFSFNGTQIVSGADDNTIRLWNVSESNSKNILIGHTSSVKSVAFSRDGAYILSGSDDNSVRIWDALTGKVKHVLKGHTDWVNSAAFSMDGTRIVSGSADGLIIVWDAIAGTVAHLLQGHNNDVKSVAFSMDGIRIVSGASDKSVRVWDALTGKEHRLLTGHSDWVHSVAFSSDGTLVVSGSADKSVRVWDALTGLEEGEGLPKGHSNSVKSVALSSDTSFIVSGSSDSTVRVWNTLGEEKHLLKGHTSSVNSVAISSDGTLIVSGSSDDSIRVWDALTGEQKHLFKGHKNSIQSVAFAPHGFLFVSGSGDKSIRMWDALTGQQDNFLGLYSPEKDWINSIALSNDSIVAGLDDGSLQLFSALTGERHQWFFGNHESTVNSVAFSRDGSMIVSGSDDHCVQVYNSRTPTANDQLVAQIRLEDCPVHSVAFSKDGTHVAAGLEDGSILVFSPFHFDAPYMRINGHIGSVRSIEFSADDTRIVSGSDDRSIRMWNICSIMNKGVHQKQAAYTLPQENAVFDASTGEDDRETGRLKQPQSDFITVPPETYSIRYTRHYIAVDNGPAQFTGWLLLPLAGTKYKVHYLMFVPPSELLPDDVNILTIPESSVSTVDFTNAKIGNEWTLCYSQHKL